jgi:hypothetical protein
MGQRRVEKQPANEWNLAQKGGNQGLEPVSVGAGPEDGCPLI